MHHHLLSSPRLDQAFLLRLALEQRLLLRHQLQAPQSLLLLVPPRNLKVQQRLLR